MDACWYYNAAINSCETARSAGCEQAQDALRGLLVGSNAFFLFPPTVMLYIARRHHHQAWDESDVIFSVSSILIGWISALYHLCDDSDRTVFCGSTCIVPHDRLYCADMMASGFALISATLLGWNPKIIVWQRVTLLIYLLYPYTALYMTAITNDYLYYVVGLGVLIWAIRLVEHELILSRQAYVLLPTAAVFALVAVFAQYTSLFNGPIGVDHSAWHIGSGTALSLTPWIYESKHKPKNNIHKHSTFC